jgi:hypothetical protein
MEIIHIPRDDPHTPFNFEKELPPIPVKKAKSLFTLKDSKRKAAQPAPPLPAYVYVKPRFPLPLKPVDHVIDIRSPSTIVGQPSNDAARKPSFLIAGDDSLYLTRSVFEKRGEISSRRYNFVRNSVSSSDINRPKSQSVKVEYFPPIPAEVERMKQEKQRPRRRQDGTQQLPVARVVNTGVRTKLLPIR